MERVDAPAGGKRQGCVAIQDASRGSGTIGYGASFWCAVALHRFGPMALLNFFLMGVGGGHHVGA
jgi:hypothetical protein